MAEISKSAVERIIKKAGAKRVSETAVEELAEILEAYGVEISRKAVVLAAHRHRKTVTARDVRLAAKLGGCQNGR